MIIQIMIKYPHQLIIALHLFGYVICFSFMLVNKRTVLSETYVSVHVRWTEKSGNQICFDWLIESDAPPRSFPAVSKYLNNKYN